MSLSKPLYSLFGVYFEQLFNHPVRTKSITASVLAASANYTSQRLAGQKHINQRNLVSYALFGLLFGGSVPHYFYQTMERLFQDVKFKRILQFLSERLMFAPFYQALSLYFLSRFEMNSHNVAVRNMQKLYWPLLQANWQYLSVPVLLNIYFVPPMFRTIVMSFISFIWVIYISHRRRRLQEKQKKDAAPTTN